MRFRLSMLLGSSGALAVAAVFVACSSGNLKPVADAGAKVDAGVALCGACVTTADCNGGVCGGIL